MASQAIAGSASVFSSNWSLVLDYDGIWKVQSAQSPVDALHPPGIRCCQIPRSPAHSPPAAPVSIYSSNFGCSSPVPALLLMKMPRGQHRRSGHHHSEKDRLWAVSRGSLGVNLRKLCPSLAPFPSLTYFLRQLPKYKLPGPKSSHAGELNHRYWKCPVVSHISM